MLRKLVGKRPIGTVQDETKAGGPNNKTAESDFVLEFTRLNGPSPPVSPANSMQKEELEEMPEERTLRTHRELEGSKYVVIWQRARAKLKSRLMLSKLRKDLNLFGTALHLQSGRSTATSLFETDVRNSVQRRCILPPRSYFVDVWQLILAISILYTTIVFPFRMAFYEKPSPLFVVLDFLVDMCFVFDILVTLNSAYFDSDFELVTNRKLIFKRYLRSWLVFDVLSCLPICTSDLWLKAAESENFSELFRMLRLPRLYRLVKIIRILDATSPSGQNGILEKCKDVLKLKHGTVKLLSTVLMIFIAIHIASCFWYLAARLADNPNTWIVRLGQEDEDTGSLYIASMYWAVTTLATVGENILVGKLAIIEEFAKDAHLSTSLKKDLRAAIQYSTERLSLSWTDKQNILNELPKKLRYELALAMHQGAARNLNFFDGKDPVFVSAIIPFMQPLFVKTGVKIFEQGEYADEVYFVVNGRVSYIMEEGGFVYRTLHQGSYFGDIEVIQMIPRKYTVSAAVDSNLLTMKKPLLDVIQNDFPSYWEEMKKVSEEREAINDSSLKQFVNLMVLKKAGQLEKANPALVREKLKRLIANRPMDPQPIEDIVTISSLRGQVAHSVKLVGDLQGEISELKEAAADILELLKVKESVKTKEPLSLGRKPKMRKTVN